LPDLRRIVGLTARPIVGGAVNNVAYSRNTWRKPKARPRLADFFKTDT
jgi:hypothetical protein